MEKLLKLRELLIKSLAGKNKRKTVENTAIALVIGIILMIVGSSFLNSSSTKKQIQAVGAKPIQEETKKGSSENDFSVNKEIEKILSQIEGAGRVSVLITYVSGKERVPATDIKKSENLTNEKDSGGGTRNNSQNNLETTVIYSEEQGGNKNPVILKEILPEVKGVVVVAEGAGNPEVKENIIRAVQVLTSIPPHKIQVFVKSK